MDSKAEMFIKRARTEIDSAEILFQASEDKKLKSNFNVMKVRKSVSPRPKKQGLKRDAF